MSKVIKCNNIGIYSPTSSRPYKAWATMGISTAHEIKTSSNGKGLYQIRITHMVADPMSYNLQKAVTSEVTVETENIREFLESGIITPDSSTVLENCYGHTQAMNSLK